MKKMPLVAFAVSAVILMAALGGLAQAETITLKSGADTLGASLGLGGPDSAMLARLDAGDATGLSFGPVILDSLGSYTPIPPGAPPGTTLINLPGGSSWNGENGFFKMTFTLPNIFANIQLTGSANVDDVGRVFLNGQAITPSNALTQSGNATFTTNNPSFFQAGQNIILISDANTGGGPSGGAFFVNVSYAPVPVPGSLLLLGSGLLGLAGLRRKFKR